LALFGHGIAAKILGVDFLGADFLGSDFLGSDFLGSDFLGSDFQARDGEMPPQIQARAAATRAPCRATKP